MKIAIIVLHYGDPSDTYKCLRSISKIKTKFRSVVILVDNGSGNLSIKKQNSNILKINFIKSKTNLGFSGGMNLGIKKAIQLKSDYILLLNNDVIVKPNLIDGLLSGFKKNTGVVGPIITYGNSDKIWFAGGYLNKFFCYTKHDYMNQKISKKIKSKPVNFITGACMCIKKDVFEKIGLLNEKYFLYWEDVDFCYRAQQAGFEIYFINQHLASHNVSASAGIKNSNQLTPLRAYYYARNPLLFINYNKLNKFTGLIGQIFIRLPYYLYGMNNINTLRYYIKGIKDGFYANAKK